MEFIFMNRMILIHIYFNCLVERRGVIRKEYKICNRVYVEMYIFEKEEIKNK